jgi:hypothetical protein
MHIIKTKLAIHSHQWTELVNLEIMQRIPYQSLEQTML